MQVQEQEDEQEQRQSKTKGTLPNINQTPDNADRFELLIISRK